MKFKSLHIANLRAIELFVVEDLKDLVIIAGPNGCGKTCIFDGMRLLKSLYGGHQQDEWKQWFQEFNVDIQNPNTAAALFRDPAQDITVGAEIVFDPSEIEYVRNNSRNFCAPLAWRDVSGGAIQPWTYSPVATEVAHAQLRPVAEERIEELDQQLQIELKRPSHVLDLRVHASTLDVVMAPALLANIVFQRYDPQHLGILDFHSASRNYAREAVGGVDLNVANQFVQRRNQALYNVQSKYSNIKSEMLGSHLRELLVNEAGAPVAEKDSLDSTMKELFQTFFPDKKFMGVTATPGGFVTFPVHLNSGETHDINDLSSGEKEVLYGYLRLKNDTPRFSTILLDEPELHLNPRLLQGFPKFYNEHLVRPNKNQLWLVTHSDALLRQAVGNKDYSVYHMVTAANAQGQSQARKVGEDDFESALVDLVGDLAAYQPHAHVLILEGGGATDFDKTVVERLFPELTSQVNVVSGSNKGRVKALYELLHGAARQTGSHQRFYAITDRDSEPLGAERPVSNVQSWDVYHIENYLLNPDYVAAAHRAADMSFGRDEQWVRARLVECAVKCQGTVVKRDLEKFLRTEIVKQIELGVDPNASEVALAMTGQLRSTLARLAALGTNEALCKDLLERERALQERLQRTIDSDLWLSDFPGRDILKAYVRNQLRGKVQYGGFVSLIVSEMVRAGYQPPGMRAVLAGLFGWDGADFSGLQHG